MFHLAYVSSARERLSQQELTALLATSRRNNQARGVSGALVYADGSFMQVLEGDEQDVRALYAVIERDPRHHDLIILDEGYAPTREFEEWSMAFRDLTGRLDDIPGFADLMEPFDLDEPNRATRLRRLVRSARLNLRAAL